MNKYHILIVFIFITLITAYVVKMSMNREYINIGVILINPLPESPEHGLFKGMNISASGINSTEGIDGKYIRLIPRVCNGKVELAKEQFRELAEQSCVIINGYSHITQALTPLAEELQVLQLSILATAEKVISSKTPYSFRYWTTASDELQGILPIFKDLRVSNLAVIHMDNTYGNSVANTFRSLLKRYQISTQSLPYTKIDDNLIPSIVNMANADAIYIASFSSDFIPLIATIRSVFPDKPIIGPSSLASPKFLRTETTQGVYFPSPIISTNNLRYVRDQKDKDSILTNNYIAKGYETINLLSQIIARSQCNPEKMKKIIEKGFVYPGIFGDVINNQGAHNFSYGMYPARIENKKIVYQRR